MNKPTLFRCCAALFLACITSTAPAQTRDGNFWIPNNSVFDILVDDSRGIVLLGGSFDYIGPYTGSGVLLDKTTGNYDVAFPQIEGSINAAVPDGSGGYFIGGYFTSVGGVSRNNLAHITSSGTVSSWNPDPNDGVDALAIDNGILYVGGGFTTIDGQSDTALASFHVSTETYNTSFQPDPITHDFFPNVHALTVYGSKLYIAGSFDSISSAARSNLAAFDKVTGALDAWNPSPSHWSDPSNLVIQQIAPYNGTLFIGGGFTSMGGQNRRSIAQVDTVTGSATSWDGDIDPYIYSSSFGSDTLSFVIALLLKGDTLYVGGAFEGFQSQTSYGVGALNASSGTFISGAVPSLEQGGTVSSFSLDGTTLYLGGDYKSIGGQQRKNLSAINAETGSLLSWNPKASDEADVLIASGAEVFIGGYLYSVNGVVRNGIAAIDQSTGVPTSWDPNYGSTDQELTVSAMDIVDTVLYIAGGFTTIGTQPRSSLAAIGLTGGGLLPFNPSVSRYNLFSGSEGPELFALAHSAGKLYVGGDLDTVNGSQRNGAAAFNLSDGSLASWNPNPTQSGESGTIEAIVIAGEKVFLGGYDFDMVGDSSRRALAAVDTGNGAVLSWNPDFSAGGYVYAMVLDGSTLFVGGGFSQIGGLTRNSLASFDTSSSIPLAWNPDLNSSVDAIAVTPSYVYAGGFFETVGASTRYSVAAIDRGTGAASDWDPQIDASNVVDAIGVSTAYEKVYFGGSFNTVLGEPSQNFGAVTNPYDAALPVELVSLTAQTNGNGVELAWITATEVNNYGFEVQRKQIPLNPPLQGGSRATGEAGRFENIGFVQGGGTSNSPKSYTFIDPATNGKIVYRLKQIDHDGKFKYSQEIEVEVVSGDAPKIFSLEQNYPNPFNPTTMIGFTIQVSGMTTLKVYDALGREVATLVNENLDAGVYHQVAFNASNLASGIYFARLQSNGKQMMKKMLLVK